MFTAKLTDARALSDNPPLSAFLLDKHNKLNSHPIKLLRFLALAHNNIISAVDQNRWVPAINVRKQCAVIFYGFF